MKKIVYIIIFCLVGCGLPPKMPAGKNIQIHIMLDSALSSHEQWVYLHRYIDNDKVVDDSVFIKKGQKELFLYAYSPEEDWFSILFSEKGPVEWRLLLTPNSYVKAPLAESDGIQVLKKVNGSYSTNEYQEYVHRAFLLNQTKRELYAQLAMPKLSDDDSRRLVEAVKRIDCSLDSLEMDLLCHSKSPTNTIAALRYFKEKVSKDSLKALCDIALIRFPKNKEIAYIKKPVRRRFLPESEESKRINKHLNSIIEKRIKEELEISSTQAERSDGNQADISNLVLYSDKGTEIKLSEMTGQYMLIDFWASWCIPCLEGMPYLRQAKQKYGDSLTICLISLDKKHVNWKRAIVDKHLDAFVNLTAVDEQGKLLPQVERLGIPAIPYNVLLDGNRKVIAVNLHQKDLLYRLDKLLF